MIVDPCLLLLLPALTLRAWWTCASTTTRHTKCNIWYGAEARSPCGRASCTRAIGASTRRACRHGMAYAHTLCVSVACALVATRHCLSFRRIEAATQVATPETCMAQVQIACTVPHAIAIAGLRVAAKVCQRNEPHRVALANLSRASVSQNVAAGLAAPRWLARKCCTCGGLAQ